MKRSTLTAAASVIIAGAALVNLQSTAPRGAIPAPYTKLVYGQLQPLTSGQTIAGLKVLGGEGIDGRGISIANVSDITVRDCMVIANGDDGGSVWGDCRRIRFENVYFLDDQAGNGAKAHQTKACLIGDAENKPAPDVPTWVTFDHCTFQAFSRAPDIRGGIARFDGCVFRPSARNVWTEAKVNISSCDFWTSTKPADATWWDEGRPICLKDPIPNSIYVDVASCTLNGQPITSANDLFRAWKPTGQYVGNDNVDPKVFRRKPW